jgi:hypothetical protein
MRSARRRWLTRSVSFLSGFLDIMHRKQEYGETLWSL